MSHTISKQLSANDTGETGAHQAGILIPKEASILSFFPKLSSDEKNPRENLIFIDDEGKNWDFCFIYYNGKLHGGTRNEYRLTKMTKFLKDFKLKAGDEISLTHEENGNYKINYQHQDIKTPQAIRATLKLGSGWKVVRFSK